jgi:protein ImuA
MRPQTHAAPAVKSSAARQLVDLNALRERLAGVGSRTGGVDGVAAGRVVPTGWDEFDAALAGGGLCRGGLHEWIGLATTGIESHASGGQRRGRWSPPLGVLVHLAARCTEAAEDERPTVCWIGRRVWPSVHALSGGMGTGSGGAALLPRSLLVDADGVSDRLWAADLAARCPGVLVVVDGSGMDMAASRRLLLAAEAGAGVGGWMVHLARPAWEVKHLSAATTRWLVARVVAASAPPACVRLRVTLVRSRGPGSLSTQDRTSVIQRDSRDRYVAVPARPAERSDASSSAA